MIHPIDRGRAIRRWEEIPRLSLGSYPTPVEKLPRLREALRGGPRLYIKRDDLTGAGGGGNKVRKLEYLLAAAQRDGADAVVTCGGVRSNHCRATAMLAARLGMECVLVQNLPAAPYPRTPASRAIEDWVGARIVEVPRREDRAPAMERAADHLRRAGRHPLIVPLGASTPLGAMGYIAAVAELAAQMAAHELRFDAIYFCSSSGGTQAGLEAGRQLFLDPGTRLIGVSPDDAAGSIQSSVAGIILGIGEMLEAEFSTELTVEDGFIGEGYGIESPAGKEAFALLARAEGILLDPVYTAKAMAALLTAIRRGEHAAGDRVLFWHTGGQLALFYS